MSTCERFSLKVRFSRANLYFQMHKHRLLLDYVLILKFPRRARRQRRFLFGAARCRSKKMPTLTRSLQNTDQAATTFLELGFATFLLDKIRESPSNEFLASHLFTISDLVDVDESGTPFPAQNPPVPSPVQILFFPCCDQPFAPTHCASNFTLERASCPCVWRPTPALIGLLEIYTFPNKISNL